MVLVHELRICHPYSVSEFERGLQFGNMKTAEQMQQEGGQGSTLMSSTSFLDNKYGEGICNVSQTRVGDRLPSWATRIISSDQLVLDDNTWFSFPFTRTMVTCPALTKLKIQALTVYLDDRGTTENALGLTKEQLAVRAVEHVDLGAYKLDPADYRKERDPGLYSSKLTGKGPLSPGWQEREKGPMMCTYKVIITECAYFPVTTQLEPLLMNLVRKLTILANQTVFTTLDEWFPLSLHQILDMRDGKARARGLLLEHRPERQRLADGSIEATTSPLKALEGAYDAAAEVERAGEEDLFLDAEADWGLEKLDPFSRVERGFSPPIPLKCPFCEVRSATRKSHGTEASVFCSTCGEFFCLSCFAKVHTTERMKQHRTEQIAEGESNGPYSGEQKAEMGQKGRQPQLLRVFSHCLTACFSLPPPSQASKLDRPVQTTTAQEAEKKQHHPSSSVGSTLSSVSLCQTTSSSQQKRKLLACSRKVHVFSPEHKLMEPSLAPPSLDIAQEARC